VELVLPSVVPIRLRCELRRDRPSDRAEAARRRVRCQNENCRVRRDHQFRRGRPLAFYRPASAKARSNKVLSRVAKGSFDATARAAGVIFFQDFCKALMILSSAVRLARSAN